MKLNEIAIEELAKALRNSELEEFGGEWAYKEVTGSKWRGWIEPNWEVVGWDSDPKNYLCEHERDDYRHRVEAVMSRYRELCMEEMCADDDQDLPGIL